HPALRPFPTRRSADLFAWPAEGAKVTSFLDVAHACRHRHCERNAVLCTTRRTVVIELRPVWVHTHIPMWVYLPTMVHHGDTCEVSLYDSARSSVCSFIRIGVLARRRRSHLYDHGRSDHFLWCLARAGYGHGSGVNVWPHTPAQHPAPCTLTQARQAWLLF